MKIRGLIAVCLVLVMTSVVNAENKVVTDMVHAAQHFMNALDEEQRETLQYSMADEVRWDWHFAPRESVGLSLNDMTMAQQQLAYALLSTALSERGMMTALTIMSLEQVLHDMQNQNPIRDPGRYFFTIFGTPSVDETWAWRIEGHHINFNLTLQGGNIIAMTPLFLGSNPGEVPSGARKGLRILGEIEDSARSLVKSLNDEQKAKAVFSETAPPDIITGVARRVQDELPRGLSYAVMTPEQKENLEALLHLFATYLRPEVVKEDWREIQNAGMDAVSFSWAGGLDRGEPHYYRLQGPTFLIEYDNTQQNANHAHSVWRNYDGDYGDDVLLDHYEAAH